MMMVPPMMVVMMMPPPMMVVVVMVMMPMMVVVMVVLRQLHAFGGSAFGVRLRLGIERGQDRHCVWRGFQQFRDARGMQRLAGVLGRNHSRLRDGEGRRGADRHDESNYAFIHSRVLRSAPFSA
jgi:hypothetical protein